MKRVMKRVAAVGIEVEGGWNKDIVDPEDGGKMIFKTDDSIRPEGFGQGTKHIGEIASPPFGSLEDANTWAGTHWPETWNIWCGMHIHVSVKKPFYYAYLASPRFFKHFIKNAGEWGKELGLVDEDPFWKRLNGQVRGFEPAKYCVPEFRAREQILVEDKHHIRAEVRRTAINYCYKLHKTLECRVFPMMNIAQGLRTVGWLVNLIEDWLAKEVKRPRPIVMTALVRSIKPIPDRQEDRQEAR